MGIKSRGIKPRKSQKKLAAPFSVPFSAALLAVMLLAAACGTDEDDTAANSTTTSSAAEDDTTENGTTENGTTETSTDDDEPTTSPYACSPEGAASDSASDSASGGAGPAKIDSTLSSGGNTYLYTTEIPSGYSFDSPSPLVFMFHGRGSSGPKIVEKTSYSQLAEKENFVLVYPTGLDLLGTPSSWEVPQFDTDDRDDVQFVRELVETVKSSVCVDTDRIYIVGSSNGAYFGSTLVCEMADVFAAAFLSAAVTHPEGCSPSQPMPMAQIHGDEDTTVRYFGGGSGLLDRPRTIIQFSIFDDQVVEDFFNQVVPDEVAEFASDFGCDEVTETEQASDVRLFTYTGCDDPNVEVLHYRVLGGGHGWPGAGVLDSQGSQRTTQNFDNTSESWAFLSQFTLNNA